MQISKLFLPAALLASFGLAACGSDSSSSPSREDDTSSSSGAGTSSSSNAASSSSEEDPNDSTRAATLADLLPVMDLGETVQGYPVYYILGKNGVYSKVYMEGTTVAAQLSGLFTLDAKGVVSMDVDHSGMFASSQTAWDKLAAERSTTPDRLFRVHKTSNKLYAGATRATWKVVAAATLKTIPGSVTDAADLPGSYTYTSKASDTLNAYSLYSDGTYVRKGRQGTDTLWEAGRYDVHNRNLIMIPVGYYASKASVLKVISFLRVSSDRTLWGEAGSSKQATYVVGTTGAIVDPATIQKAWEVTRSAEKEYWTLDVKADSAVLEVVSTANIDGFLYKDAAYWKIFGEYLLLDFDSYPGSCSAIKGTTVSLLVDHNMNCASQILAAVSVDNGVLSLSQSLIPASWTAP